ncbi:hypothetical protein BV25DRAFT_1361534 [Artomyces pyxidatus]|uniref:Uncharacterized protein n=1 Tax=Artomyces pyxidatus TaxID=48021 RepID=A0ACB8SP96_9AGAM|nr:hypothetical protein BV25DRAFT_1361534 [Artomyces pyxidatus]
MATACLDQLPQDPPCRDWMEEEADRQRIAENKYWKSVIEQRKPVATLPFKYRVTRDRPDPPVLVFGFPRTRQQLFEYARKHDLRNADYPDELVEPDICLSPSVMRLREVADEPYLSITSIFSPTESELHIVALYSNYTMGALKCVPADEEDIIKRLQIELGVDERPMWHWDVINNY